MELLYKTNIKEKKETVVIELLEFDNLEVILSRIIIPFSEVIRQIGSSDIYDGHEKIPFKLRDPLYKKLLLQEFESVLQEFEISKIL
jgi:hypothetical protein